MRFLILVAMLSGTLYLLRDSGPWSLVVLPYVAAMWFDGFVHGHIATVHRVVAKAIHDAATKQVG